jgi:beta-glucanase (GH16 family)
MISGIPCILSLVAAGVSVVAVAGDRIVQTGARSDPAPKYPGY